MSLSLKKASASTTEATASKIDPFVLDFGSSVNISEELNRSIRTEIKAIDDDINSLQNEYKTEERVNLQHRKDFSHALTEMNRLNRDAHEDLEQARVREHLLIRQRDSVETDISSALTVVTPSSSPSSDGNKLQAHDETNMDDGQNANSDSVIADSTGHEFCDGFDRNLSTCAETYKMELKRLSEILQKDHSERLVWLNKVRSLEEECALKKAKVDELSKLSHDVSQQQDEIQHSNLLEKQRVERLHECIEKEKENNVNVDNAVAEQTMALSAMKLQHAHIENQLQLEKDSLSQAVESLKSELIEVTETLAKSTEEAQILEAHITALEQFHETSKRLELDHEKVKEALIEKANQGLYSAQDSRRRVDELKMAHDMEEDQLIKPAQDELKLLDEEKSTLGQITISLHEKLQMLEEDDRMFFEEQASLSKQLSTEYDNFQDIVASRKAEQESIRQLMEDTKANFACDVEAKLVLIAGLEEQIKYNKQSIEDAKEARQVMIHKHQDELRCEHQKRLEMERMKLQMYERAIMIMAESDEKVRSIRETNAFIVVSDNFIITSNLSNKRTRNVDDSMSMSDDDDPPPVENKVKTKARSVYGRK